MKKLKAIKRFMYRGKFVMPEDVLDVDNNDAHTLIDGGFAVLPLSFEEIRMVLSERKKGYKTK